MRLLAGLLAAQPFDSVMIGDESLSVRPMKRVTGPLMEMGARLAGEVGKVAGEVYPPLQIKGVGSNKLRGIHFEQPVASAQVKSALLLAGLFADSPTVVVEPGQSRNSPERCP